MPELSIQNIEQISLDIKRQEITYSCLADELIDHICCDVENEMQNGLDFPDAYRIVLTRIAPRRIKEIQEETLYAVDSKYRNMKNTMKFSGIAGTILFGFATLFKIQHWPFGGTIMVLGALMLAFVFLPSALGVLWKETHSGKKLFLFISGFLTGTLFIFGTLFKIQHWPEAGIILSLSVIFAIGFLIPALLLNRLADPASKPKRVLYFLGAAGCILYVTGLLFKIQHWPLALILMGSSLIILFAVTLPWYTWLTWKDEPHVSSAFIFLIVGSLLIVVPGVLINLNLRNMYNGGYYRHLEQAQKMYNVRFGMNNSIISQYHDSLCFADLELLHAKTAEALACLQKTEKNMVEESEGHGNPSVGSTVFEQTLNGPEIRFTKLSNPFASIPVKEFLLPDCKARQELDKAFTDYMSYVTSLTPAKETARFSGLLDPSLYLPGGKPAQPDVTLLSALHSIEILKNNLLAVESCMMNFIVKQ